MAGLHSVAGEKINRRLLLTPQDNYQVALDLACEQLRNADLNERSAKSGAVLEKRESGKAVFKITFLNQVCEIQLPSMEMGCAGSEEEMPVWAKILILHYLNHSKGLPLSGEWITFRQLPGGSGYYPAHAKRTLNPLINAFGSNPEQWLFDNENPDCIEQSKKRRTAKRGLRFYVGTGPCACPIKRKSRKEGQPRGVAPTQI